jgi:signal transduction histidine kinase
MRLTPSDTDKFRLLAIGLIVAVTIISTLSGLLLGKQTSERIRDELRERSQTMAAALDTDEIIQLQGKASDADLPAYEALKERLAAIKHANPDTRSIYLMGRQDDRVFFFVDSETTDSPDYSPAATWYDDATEANIAMFDNGKPVVEGPASDSYGTFISGLAPIFRPNSNEVVAVVGLDVAATTYWRDILLQAAIPLLTGLSIILIIVVFESVRRRNRQLLAVQSELVSVASHELRNPITGIRWAAESLQKMTADEKLRPMIHAIYGSAVRLEDSTDDILELSHAMTRTSLTLVPTDMSKLLQEVLDVQSLSAQKRGVKLELDTTWPAELQVTCDADKMKRVLHNVISNAIKYTRENTIVTVAYDGDERYHHIRISDEGIGIPADEQSKVFSGFYRASNAKAAKIKGTGFGLYLVRIVLEQHGGKVSFDSTQDKGTTFDLALPKQ